MGAVMYRFLLIMLFCLSTQAADYSHLKEIEKAKGNLIYGEAVTAKDLKGKVILFEYWGTN